MYLLPQGTQAFDYVSHELLISKLFAYEFKKKLFQARDKTDSEDWSFKCFAFPRSFNMYIRVKVFKNGTRKICGRQI